MDKEMRKQIDHSLIVLIVRSVLSIVLISGIFYIANKLVKFGVHPTGRDVFNVLLGSIATVFIINWKYWFERSADYTESKNVERANKLNEGSKPIEP